MRIATWNVNSIKARLPTVLEVLDAINCDVVCLQEIKCETDAFPYLELEERGWNCAVLGQKSYNGVALLSKHEIEDVTKGLPTIEDEQARYIEALILSDTPIRVGGLYLPNGNPAPGPKYDYKMEWMDALERHARELLKLDPTPADCWDETVWQDDALALPQTRAEFRKLKYLGLADSFELTDNRAHQYTFWDYQGGAFKKDHGIRIDHLLCSPQACDRLQSVEIYRKARELEKPSDHVPVIGVFED